MAVRRADVVAAALGILDQFGLADLTMRRVGSALEVKAGALYWHFPNKQSLLAAVADAILAEVVAPEPGPWRPWLAAWTDRLRTTLLRHRDAAELVSATLATGLGAVDLGTPPARVLHGAGLGEADARAAARALVHLTLGQVSEEQTRATLSEVGVVSGHDPEAAARDHAAGVALLLDGLASRLRD